MKRINFKITTIMALFIITVSFQSCSSDNRIKQAKEKLEQRVLDESKGLIKLKSLDKVNGQESNLMGSKMYEMDFKLIIEYQDDCYKNVDSWGGFMNNYFTVVKNPQQEQRGFYNTYSPDNYRHYIKGTKEEITGAAFYEMKENGWFLNDLSLKSSKQL